MTHWSRRLSASRPRVSDVIVYSYTTKARHNMGSVEVPHYVVDEEACQKLEDALRAIVKALGELPAGNLDQASQKAYRAADDLLDPDEFTARFMAQARGK